MRIYFLGICGTAMGNVAVLMQKTGHTVGGSDTGIYPPMSTVLSEAGIEIHQGWDETKLIEFQPDLVVIGNAVSRGNPEVEFLLRTKQFSFVSLPDLIGNQLLKSRPRIVITGTHGKTTTTALTAWLLKEAGREPGWLIGGIPNSLSSGSELGSENSHFVLEGDEYDSAFFDKRSKFIHYLPDVLVINNIEFDHADIFRDLTDVKRTFNHLIRIVPPNGVILANGDDPVIRELLPVSWTKAIFVGVGKENDFRICDFEEQPGLSRFSLVGPSDQRWTFETRLNGEFNARNTAMALLACGIALDPLNPTTSFGTARLKDYEGVARRQDELYSSEQLLIIEDFAHHPTAIRLCIDSFKNCYPDHQVVAVFEPRSNTSATNILQAQFTAALSHAHEVFISPVHRGECYSDDLRLDPTVMVASLVEYCSFAEAFDTNEALFAKLAESTGDTKRLILLFTNGSFGQPLCDYLESLR